MGTKEYHIKGHFVQEPRKGFAVHSQMDSIVTVETMNDRLNSFIGRYSSQTCYGLEISIKELGESGN